MAVAHMGPPLEIDGQMTANVIGSVGLTPNEIYQIQIFIDQHTEAHQAKIKSGEVSSPLI